MELLELKGEDQFIIAILECILQFEEVMKIPEPNEAMIIEMQTFLNENSELEMFEPQVMFYYNYDKR